MDDFLKQALEIVKAQASIRDIGADEILSMMKNLSAGIRGMSGEAEAEAPSGAVMDPRKSIKENSVICLECGMSFKVLTKRHLVQHGLTPADYRAKYGMKKGATLAARSLRRARRKKMNEMKLWERRKPKAAKVAPVPRVERSAKPEKGAKAAKKSEILARGSNLGRALP